MKHLLLSLFFIGFIGSLTAQRLVKVEPLTSTDLHIEDISDYSLEIKFVVRLTNLSKDTLALKWDKKIFNQPEDWVTQVNDENGIYLPNVQSNYGPIPGADNPLMIPPGEASEVSMHVLPLGTEGDGWYELSFSYADAPGYILESVGFNARAGSSTAGYKTSKADISVYPNPANFYFEVSPNNLTDQIEVFNVVGGKVLSFTYEHGQKYSISNLPSGLYLVSLVNEKNGVVKTVRLLKRLIRS